MVLRRLEEEDELLLLTLLFSEYSFPDAGELKRDRTGVRISEIHSCCSPSRGFIRFSGSQIKHREMKSRNNGSLHLRACPKVFEPGRRFLPLELTTNLGLPMVS